MSVISADELTTERSEGDDGTVTYNVTWQVITNDRADGIIVAMSAADLPKRGDSYAFGGESDLRAVCRSRKANYAAVDDTRKRWLVALEYSTKGNAANPQDQNGGSGDPIDWSWHVDGDAWSHMVAPDADRNGRAFVNVCGEPFMPPPEKEDNNPLIVLTKNHPTLDLAAWSTVQGRVNSVAIWGLAARKVKIRKWTFKEHWLGGGQMYFSNRYDVEIKFNGFFFEPPNLGMNFIDGIGADGNPNVRVILDDRGIPVARPQKLDQFGGRIPAGGAAVFFDQVGGALQRFEPEDEYDFSNILPATLPGNFLNAS